MTINTLDKNEPDIMNPPESFSNEQELQEKLLLYLEEHKKDGKHREWYEPLLVKWAKRRENFWTFDVIKTCLCENPPENYSDIDYVAALLKATAASSDDFSVTWLVRIVREITKRKLVLDRNLPAVKDLLSRNSKDYSNLGKNHALSMEMETYAATIMLLAESITLYGETQYEAYDLEPWEKKLLQQPNLEAVAKCIQSGFFVQEKAEDYLDYIADKGAKGLTPLFVSLKYKKNK